MAYFEWAKDMEIDGGAIDADHHRLVDLVNDLHTATSVGEGQAVVADILASLIKYTKTHLKTEEELMARMHFPHMEGHQRGHEKFIEDLLSLEKKYQNGSITVASQLSTVLRDWLSLHIRRNDKELHQYFKRG
ncbi:bacteriohemerythrin [Rhodoferax sp. GW822-FHT02A01]|uniref:bacteriohemerythrin n=1 Tax=Rhodoferax sp. GW822-FHT02A01 TaxID=3141537 RepID=UPI00315CA092